MLFHLAKFLSTHLIQLICHIFYLLHPSIISHFQPAGIADGNRLTSAAGGQDDGETADGALLTVGGLGDTNDNPPDPNSDPQSDFTYDDELYNLIPFVSTGDRQIDVFTTNPSDDDNIFFAYLKLNSTTAIVGEGVTLSPTQDEKCHPADHTVTARVQDDNGDPIANRAVSFEVVSGPHAGTTGTSTTNDNGEATFTYSGTAGGVDTIVARFQNQADQTVTSNTATINWECPMDVTLGAASGHMQSQLNVTTLLGSLLPLLLVGAFIVFRSKKQMTK